jgi:hypothetical protein
VEAAEELVCWIRDVELIPTQLRQSYQTVTYPGFAWLIRRVLNLLIKFIWPLYNWLHEFTNHYLMHCHLLPTGHSTGTILTSNWTPTYSVVLLQLWSELRLIVPSNNCSAWTPRKTPSSMVKNACLLVRYLTVHVLLLKAYAWGLCLSRLCLAMGICVTICCDSVLEDGQRGFGKGRSCSAGYFTMRILLGNRRKWSLEDCIAFVDPRKASDRVDPTCFNLKKELSILPTQSVFVWLFL